MSGVLTSLAILACPVGMGAMMWFMAKGMGGGRKEPAVPPSLEGLREEHRRIEGDLRARESSHAAAER